MIELYLSTDGKHTVRVSAETPQQIAELVPQAKALYREVLAEFGTKAQMWQAAGNGKANGHAPFGKHVDTVMQAQQAVAPHCPMHHRPMALRSGRLGQFWSCPTRNPDGRWCAVTQEVSMGGNGQATMV